MRETEFIEQNKHKWIEFEELYKNGNEDPEKLSNLFVQITDDLAYARTHYPNRAVRVYLNDLAQNVLFNIQTKREKKRNFIIKFYLEELPLIVYQYRKQLIFTFIFFTICFLIGAVTSYYNKDFATEILGANYIAETEANIAKGDPMAIYKSQSQLPMFLRITQNNIQVSMLTFISGLLLGLGSIYFLFTNGIMLGAFQFYFFQKGLLISSLLSIWLHGTLEISSIILAGGAGIVMGQGILFPGTLSRMQSLIISSRQGLKLLMGIIPLIVIAGIIESFLTRYTFAPSVLKASLIFVSLLFIVLYFIFYPIIKNRNAINISIDDYKLNPTENSNFNTHEIYKSNEILKFVFYFIKENAFKIISKITIVSGLIALVVFYYFRTSLFNRINPSGYQILTELFDYENNSSLFIINTILFTSVFLIVSYILNNGKKILKPSEPGLLLIAINSLLMSIILNLIFVFPTLFTVIIFILLLPGIFIAFSISLIKQNLFILNISEGISLFYFSFIKNIGVYVLSSFLIIAFFLLCTTTLSQIYLELLYSNIPFSANRREDFYIITQCLLVIINIGISITILLVSYSITYYSIIELKTAKSLTERIKNLF